MKRVAEFQKVSKSNFIGAWQKAFNTDGETAAAIYDKIILPKRATAGSAGYDFFAPEKIVLLPKEHALIPTGIRARIDNGWVLKLYPRSGLGFKYRMQIFNTTGIIDADYYGSDNEGHIFCKIYNGSPENKTLTINGGDAFCQGIFVEYGITYGDGADAVRNGGFGSTDK